MISPGSTLKSSWELLYSHHGIYKKQTQFLCLSVAFSLLFRYRSHISFFRSFILVSWFCKSQQGNGCLVSWKTDFFFSPLHPVIKPFSEFCVKCVKEILPQKPQLPGCLDSSQLHEAKNPSGHIKRIPSKLSKTLLGISSWGLQTWHSQNRNLDTDVTCSQVT